jgi:hypothetical protein
VTTRTRYFVVASLAVLMLGLASALVAYYVGLPAGAFQSASDPDELRYIPRHATLLAFANVREIMTSALRERLRVLRPGMPDSQNDFQRETGISIETDIDRVVAAAGPADPGGRDAATGVVLARGRFDEARIESIMRNHGAVVEDYKGARLILASGSDQRRIAVAFVESGLAAIGSPSVVRSALDLKNGGDNVSANAELMQRVRALDRSNVWAVGRFDALTAQARLPDNVAQQIPALTWFSASGRVNGGVAGALVAEARDEIAANSLREVVRGFLALAKLQSAARPELLSVIDSLQLGGEGHVVSLGFSIPAEAFDLFGRAAR